MYKRIHVYDLDGTLVDSSHRYRALPNGNIDLDHWRANEHRIFDDTLLPLAEQYKADIADPETYVVICTLREPEPEQYIFIRERLGMPNKLILNRQRLRKSAKGYKYRELAKLFNLKQFKNLPRYFWEDSEAFIKETETLFTKCFHVESNQNFVTE
jgi:hypothetical protein